MRLLAWTLIFSWFLAPWFSEAKANLEAKVVLVIIDGMRNKELDGKAKDDWGRFVPPEELFPHFLKLKKQAAFFPHFKISNPVGISLPAYADILSGRRQEKILSNSPKAGDLRSEFPTLFEFLQASSLGPSAVFASWKPVCDVTTLQGGKKGFHESCGWEKGDFKPEMFPGLRTDADTHLRFEKDVRVLRPRFVFVQLGDADSEGHFHEAIQQKSGGYYGIFHYHNALKNSDYVLGRIWKFLQDDPFYKDQTYLVVTTDHGRDNKPDPEQWANHGHCVKNGLPLCSGCTEIFAMILGPGIRAQTVKKPTP